MSSLTPGVIVALVFLLLGSPVQKPEDPEARAWRPWPIVAGFKQRYLIAYTPMGALNQGWHPIEVRVKGRRADVRARRGYSR